MRVVHRKDQRPAAFFERFHRRSRRRNPVLQALAAIALVPLLSVLARIRIAGREHIPAGGFIAAANHPSLLDPLFVALPLRRRVHFMGKSELFDAGLRGWLYSRLGGFPVRRGVWDDDAFATAAAILARGKVMAMFPEGGVSAPDGTLRDARAGIGHVAHANGATILPIHLAGTRRLYRPWTWAKVTITIGPAFTVPKIEHPTREECQRTAEQILATIAALGATRS